MEVGGRGWYHIGRRNSADEQYGDRLPSWRRGEGGSSSVMARTVASSGDRAKRAQQMRAAQRQYEAYQQKLGMMPGLLEQSRQEPYRAAKMIGDRSREILEMFLHYLGLAKPTVATDQSGWDFTAPKASQQKIAGKLDKVF